MTATDNKAKTVFETSKIYMPQSTNSLNNTMVYGPDKKLGIIRDTSIQPFASKEEIFEIKVPESVKSVNVVVNLSYQLRPGDIYPIQRIVKKVPIESPQYE
ncbi:MAG: hypothetical protein P8012_16605 [Desulfobacterales bacterium]